MVVPQANTGVAIDKRKISARYHRERSKYGALLDEAVFVLNARLGETEIKLHAIEHRVKTLESLLEKCERHVCDAPFDRFHDICGARVICLFKDDLEAIGKILGDCFDVIEIDDKRIVENAPLGYQSVHYICRMPDRYKGPRYDQTRSLTFEIQVRTLCMHCWAAVSHYIDYKGDWDVPNDLKLALSALGGLFFVADNEFQQFHLAREQSKKMAESASPEKLSEVEINLDTMSAYLKSEFPFRAKNTAEEISELVLDIKSAGYSSISTMNADVLRASHAFSKYEEEHPPGSGKLGTEFSAVGVVRISLCIASEQFFNHFLKKFNLQNDMSSDYRKYLYT